MTIVVRAGGRGRTPWELPGSRFRTRADGIVKGGRRTLYELAVAIAATGREVELRGVIAEEAFEGICAAAGARPLLDPSPRLPRTDDTIILPEGWPHPGWAPYVFSGARCIVMLLAPPGFAGWPYDDKPFERPDPLTIDLESVGRPEQFRAIAGIGCETWTQSRGVQRAAQDGGVECTWIGSGQPEAFPEPGAKDYDLVVVKHNRWASLALAVAERTGRSLLRLPNSGHAAILRGVGSARVLVWPSRVEGHSRIQVEARAMETVPVALATNPFAEGLGPEGGAVLVDSLEEMPAAIGSLLDRPAELQRLAARARETARAQVDWDAYVERIDAVLDAAPPPRPAAAARHGIVTELARDDYRLRERLERAEAAAADPDAPPRRGGVRLPFRRKAR